MDITWDIVGEGALLAAIILIVFGLGKSLATVAGIEVYLMRKGESASRGYKQKVRKTANEALWNAWVEASAGVGTVTVILTACLLGGSLTQEGWFVFGALWVVFSVPMILLYIVVSRVYRLD